MDKTRCISCGKWGVYEMIDCCDGRECDCRGEKVMKCICPGCEEVKSKSLPYLQHMLKAHKEYYDTQPSLVVEMISSQMPWMKGSRPQVIDVGKHYITRSRHIIDYDNAIKVEVDK